MAHERPGQSEITTKLSQNAAKNIFRVYMWETSVFRNDEILAFLLDKKIIQDVLEDSMQVARHKKTRHTGWYAHGVEYISFGNPDQESKHRYLFVDDFEAITIEFSSVREAMKVLEFK